MKAGWCCLLQLAASALASVASFGSECQRGQEAICSSSSIQAPLLLQKATSFGSVLKLEKDTSSLHILCYNVWWWGSPCYQTSDYSCLTGMHDYWKSLPTVDLAGVQECDGGWGTLKSYFGGTADYLTEAAIDGNLCTLYNPARFQLISSGRATVGTGDFSYRYAAYVRLSNKESGETVFFVNTHWDHLRRDPSVHAKNTAAMIREQSLPEDIVIVVGDFNQNPDTSVFSDIFESQLGLRREATGSAMGGIDMIWSNHGGGSACQSPEDYGSDHNPVFCEFTTCLDCPPRTTTTTTPAPRIENCASFEAWPDVDGGVTCAGCTALVLTAPYGGRCDRYCESFGHLCIASAEEQNEDCLVKSSKQCNEPIFDTSDMLCTCEVDRGQTGVGTETPSTSLATFSSSPLPTNATSRQWYGLGRVTKKYFWKQMRGIGFSPTDARGSESFMSRSSPVMSRLDDALTKVIDNGYNMIRTWRTHSYEELVLQRIAERGLDIKVQLGIDIANDGHARQLIDEAAAVAMKYPQLILGFSIGNERIWLGALSADTILEHVRYAKTRYEIPVTYNFVEAAVTHPEDNVRARNSGRLCEELDYVNVHLYGGAHSKRYDGSWTPYDQLEQVKREEQLVVAKIGRHKPMIIGETGWQDRGYAASSVEALREYYIAITRHVYTHPESLADSMFFFNLNDERWKGGDDSWGLYEQGDADGIGDTQNHRAKFSLTSVASILNPSQNMYEKVSGVGSWGGWCTCPDGQRYQVGDKHDACANGPSSLACDGGVAGNCERSEVSEREGMRVICAAAPPASTTTSTTSIKPTTSTMSTAPATFVSSTTAHPATSTNLPGMFWPVGGGGRACRGVDQQDNSASNYDLGRASSLPDCQSKCVATPGCKGIEFNSAWGRCEVWIQPIHASVAVAGFDCYLHDGNSSGTLHPTTSTAMPNAGSFQLVRGGGRACRGAGPQDNSDSNYDLMLASTLSNCQSRCVATPGCQGIEFNAASKRCEVWKRPIQSSVAVAGFNCYLNTGRPGATSQPTTSAGMPSAGSFHLVRDGDRACRGADSQDNSASNYNLESAESLSNCQSKCLALPECKGVEYNGRSWRCEVWTQSIQSSQAVNGFECYTRSSSPAPGTQSSTSQPASTSSMSTPQATSTSFTTTALTAACYGELSAVAAEEGGGLGQIETLSQLECQNACTGNDRCQSAAFCPSFKGCYLKDKQFIGNEPTRTFHDCNTFYKRPCNGIGGVVTSTASSPSLPPSSELVTVMTYNTVYTGYPCCGSNKVPQFGAKIRDVGPAVVGGQEVQDKGLLGKEAGYQVVPGTGPQNPILYNPGLVTLVSGSGGFMDIPKDCYAQRTITWAKFQFGRGVNEFWFFNTHLPHNGCEASSRDTHARIAKMLVNKREELGAASMPTAVVCDCNPFASSGSSDGSFESNLATAGIRLAYMGRGTQGGYAGLDKIFASDHFTELGGADHGTGSSDHPAITADLVLSS